MRSMEVCKNFLCYIIQSMCDEQKLVNSLERLSYSSGTNQADLGIVHVVCTVSITVKKTASYWK